jgi:hypothetical protein
MIQRLVPAKHDRGWGRVIWIGGGLAWQTIPMKQDYNVSFVARHNLAVSLVIEFKDFGITLNIG